MSFTRSVKQKEPTWQMEKKTEASYMGNQFALAIAAVAAGTFDELIKKQKAKEPEPIRKVFWEEKRFNPPLANTHISREYDAHEIEQKRYWNSKGVSFTMGPRIKEVNLAGPLKPAEFPKLFEKGTKSISRVRQIRPFSRAHKYNKPVTRKVEKYQTPFDRRATMIGPTTYQLPDPWDKYAAPSINSSSELSCFRSNVERFHGDKMSKPSRAVSPSKYFNPESRTNSITDLSQSLPGSPQKDPLTAESIMTLPTTRSPHYFDARHSPNNSFLRSAGHSSLYSSESFPNIEVLNNRSPTRSPRSPSRRKSREPGYTFKMRNNDCNLSLDTRSALSYRRLKLKDGSTVIVPVNTMKEDPVEDLQDLHGAVLSASWAQSSHFAERDQGLQLLSLKPPSPKPIPLSSITVPGGRLINDDDSDGELSVTGLARAGVRPSVGSEHISGMDDEIESSMSQIPPPKTHGRNIIDKWRPPIYYSKKKSGNTAVEYNRLSKLDESTEMEFHESYGSTAVAKGPMLPHHAAALSPGTASSSPGISRQGHRVPAPALERPITTGHIRNQQHIHSHKC